MFDFQQFKRLATLYTDRYGSFNMSEETGKMWHDKLKTLDFDKIKAVMIELIGAKEKPFGWKAVLTHLDLMYPPEDAQAALERKWRADPKNAKNEEKQKEINVFMRGLLDQIKESKRKKEEFDWPPLYAQNFIEVFGREEADCIARSLAYGNDVDKRFSQAIREFLR